MNTEDKYTKKDMLDFGRLCSDNPQNDNKTLDFDKIGTIFSVNPSWEPGDRPWPVGIKYKPGAKADFLLNSFYHFDAVKPLLVPLSNMTEDIAIDLITQVDFYKGKNVKISRIERGHIYFKHDETAFVTEIIPVKGSSPEHFLYLLKHGYDLFGLIDIGLALDRSKHNEHQ